MCVCSIFDREYGLQTSCWLGFDPSNWAQSRVGQRGYQAIHVANCATGLPIKLTAVALVQVASPRQRLSEVSRHHRLALEDLRLHGKVFDLLLDLPAVPRQPADESEEKQCERVA